MSADQKTAIEQDDFFHRIGKWIIVGIVLSFAGGIALFMTIGMQRSGDPIPIDAAPNYFITDAGTDASPTR